MSHAHVTALRAERREAAALGPNRACERHENDEPRSEIRYAAPDDPFTGVIATSA